MKRILLAASECVPFIKTGGLADVIGALPKHFDKSKYDIRVILPKYSCIDKAFFDAAKKIASCTVTLNWRHQYADVWSLQQEGLTYYFIDNSFYFDVDKPYSEIHTDAEKFAFFAKAVLTVLPLIGYQPDIIHCNDWQLGFLPVFLKEQFQTAFYKNVKTLFTIHNLRFQGVWNMDAYKDITGLPDTCFAFDKLEHYGNGNPLKGGLAYADYITTVSNTYTEEIQTAEYGEGLEGLISYRKDDVYGIVNGLDIKLYNPAVNKALTERFDVSDAWEKKAVNKVALQKELDLNIDENAFLVGMVTRITDQKGFDLILDKIEDMMQLDKLQIALQGTGDPFYQDKLKVLASKHTGKMAVRIQYSEELANRIYGSSVAFLMPSLFEPCGLSQLISLRYGTIPIVRATGGLKDTVKPYDPHTESGVGFVFEEYSGDAMYRSVTEAYDLYTANTSEWKKLIVRAMQQDSSWKNSADCYAKLYDLE